MNTGHLVVPFASKVEQREDESYSPADPPWIVSTAIRLLLCCLNLQFPPWRAAFPERASGVKGLLAIFWDHLGDCLRTLHAKARKSFFLAVRIGFRDRFWDLAVTVMFFEVVRAVLFVAAAPPSIPS
jgi:hypothetical protein